MHSHKTQKLYYKKLQSFLPCIKFGVNTKFEDVPKRKTCFLFFRIKLVFSFPCNEYCYIQKKKKKLITFYIFV